MHELDSISIGGFKSIASVNELKLGGVNVVIGANGSGKSNFIGAFSFLHALREGRLQDYVVKAGGADKILHFGSKVTAAVSLHISFRGGINQYRIELQPTEHDELVPVSEFASFHDMSRYPQPYNTRLPRVGKEAGISAEPADKVVSNVRERLGRWRLYHFHDTSSNSPLRKTADLHDNRYLRPDGANLAAFLYFLKQREHASYELIRRTVARVAPFFADFQLAPQELNPTKIRLEWRHRGSDAYFDSSSFSDGTLRFIALATLFLQPETLRPSVVLVDEPELGLHPHAITKLASLVQQAAVKTQVILSTQSPTLLDHFEPGEVLVADLVSESTELTRLDANRLESWLETYSLGQLWEKNEVGGRPGSS